MNRHGKVDRKALEPDHRRQPQDGHVDPVAYFSDLWSKTLALSEGPQPSDSFLACGGDSFLAVSLANALKEVLPGLEAGFMQSLLTRDFQYVSNLIQRTENGRSSSAKKIKLDTSPTTFSDEKREGQDDEGLGSSGHFWRLKGRRHPQSQLIAQPSSRHLISSMLWKINFEKCIDSSPLLVGSGDEAILVVGSHSGFVKAVEARTGSVKWSCRYLRSIAKLPSLKKQNNKLKK